MKFEWSPPAENYDEIERRLERKLKLMDQENGDHSKPFLLLKDNTNKPNIKSNNFINEFLIFRKIV